MSDLINKPFHVDKSMKNKDLLEYINEHPEVKVLKLPFNSEIHDGTIEQLTQIEELDISHSRSSRITMDSIMHLCLNGSLKKINIVNNSNFRHADVTNLLNCGLIVDHSYNPPSTML